MRLVSPVEVMRREGHLGCVRGVIGKCGLDGDWQGFPAIHHSVTEARGAEFLDNTIDHARNETLRGAVYRKEIIQ